MAERFFDKHPVRVFIKTGDTLFDMTSIQRQPGGITTASGYMGGQEVFFASRPGSDGTVTTSVAVPQIDQGGNLIGFNVKPYELNPFVKRIGTSA